MPYKSEKIKLNGLQDRRKKLTNDQKQDIAHIYSLGLSSLNTLAKQFNVSKKTILLTVNPVSAEKSKQYTKEHWKDHQEDKAERRKTIKEHRRYKQRLYIKGELKK